jgi:hypothetical protein
MGMGVVQVQPEWQRSLKTFVNVARVQWMMSFDEPSACHDLKTVLIRIGIAIVIAFSQLLFLSPGTYVNTTSLRLFLDSSRPCILL